MECRWSNIEVTCLQCNGGTIPQFTQVSADAEFRFVAFCPNCQVIVQWRIFASQLQHLAFVQDLMADEPKPPMLPSPLYTVDDQQFFTDMGINGKGEQDAA